MSALLLLFVQNPQMAMTTPQGLRHGYEPFWASHHWLAERAHLKQRVITADEYRVRVLRSDSDALKLRCGERGMTPCATREETIAALLACLDVPAPDHLDVATWAELVQECRLLNLNAAGSEDDLRARIRDSSPSSPSSRRGPCASAHRGAGRRGHQRDRARAHPARRLPAARGGPQDPR
jgi:hypothetical protein